MKINKQYDALYEMLPVGNQNAIKLDDLAAKTNINRRELQHAFHIMREQGYMVLSGSKGIFRPSDDPEEAMNEISHFRNTLTARSTSMLSSLKATNRFLKEVQGQISLQDLEV